MLTSETVRKWTEALLRDFLFPLMVGCLMNQAFLLPPADRHSLIRHAQEDGDEASFTDMDLLQ